MQNLFFKMPSSCEKHRRISQIILISFALSVGSFACEAKSASKKICNWEDEPYNSMAARHEEGRKEKNWEKICESPFDLMMKYLMDFRRQIVSGCEVELVKGAASTDSNMAQLNDPLKTIDRAINEIKLDQKQCKKIKTHR